MLVKFIDHYDIYMPGEIASFPDTLAAGLVAARSAILVGPESPTVPTLSGQTAVWSKFLLDVTTNPGFWTINGARNVALAAGLTQDIALITVGTRTLVHSCFIKHTRQFAAPSLTSALFIAGTDTDKQAPAPAAYDASAAVGSVPYHTVGRTYVIDAVPATISAYVVTTGANISALTAGAIEVDILTTQLP